MPLVNEKKNRIAVLIGSPYNIIAQKGNLYNLIQNKLNSNFERVSKYVYNMETPNSSLFFYACYKPKRDVSYFLSRQEFKKNGVDVPPPTNEVVSKISGIDKILFFGTCGSLDGRKNQIYLPTESYNTSFRNTFIKNNDIEKIKIQNPIIYENIFLNRLNVKRSRSLTSNITFIPDRIQDNSREYLKRLVDKLNKKVDCVDLESYYIVKKFSNKIPIGILLFSSDIIGKHTKMRFKLREFQKRVSDMVGDLTK